MLAASRAIRNVQDGKAKRRPDGTARVYPSNCTLRIHRASCLSVGRIASDPLYMHSSASLSSSPGSSSQCRRPGRSSSSRPTTAMLPRLASLTVDKAHPSRRDVARPPIIRHVLTTRHRGRLVASANARAHQALALRPLSGRPAARTAPFLCTPSSPGTGGQVAGGGRVAKRPTAIARPRNA